MKSRNTFNEASIEERLFEEASARFLCIRAANTAEEIAEMHAELDEWIAESPLHQKAYAKVETVWGVIGENATGPDMMIARRDALYRAKKTAQIHWNEGVKIYRYAAIAAIILVAVAAVPLFHLIESGRSDNYTTTVGEIRFLTLTDNSRILLDAETRLTVDYSLSQRAIELLHGQAHFEVAKDKRRPFKVNAGEQTVIALGTAFNMEFLNDQLLVTLVEGRVSIAPERQSTLIEEQSRHVVVAQETPVSHELIPGQQLIVRDGVLELKQEVNLEMTTAWQRGKLIFENEPLSMAVARMNRYSHIKIMVQDEEIDSLGVSGVFNVGDVGAFVEALEAYFPIVVARNGTESVHLIMAE